MKQVILIRTDLKLPKGKLAVQVAHAAVEATLKAPKDTVSKWRREGMMKAVLKVAKKEDLFKYKTLAEDNGITTALITDAGKTTVEPGTITCLAIGPEKEEKIDALTKNLSLV
jgi:peptidyl-tRNA hydrolase, PTH2 family